MRKRVNDKIFIFNENEEWSGRLQLEGKKVVPEHLIKKSETSPDIWLCFALIKSKNLNYLIESNEIGLKKLFNRNILLRKIYTKL